MIRVILCEQLDSCRRNYSLYMWVYYLHSCVQLSHYHLQKHQYAGQFSFLVNKQLLQRAPNIHAIVYCFVCEDNMPHYETCIGRRFKAAQL